MTKKRVLIEPLSWRFREVMLSVMLFSMMTLLSCTTLLTRSFADKSRLMRYKGEELAVLPPYRDFHGWDVSLQCLSVYRSNNEARNNLHSYRTNIWPRFGGDTSVYSPHHDSILVLDIEMVMFPSKETVMLKRIPRIGKPYTDPGRRGMSFESVTIPTDVDSVQVDYQVVLSNYVTEFQDSAAFSYMLYRYEKKERIPFLFTGE